MKPLTTAIILALTLSATANAERFEVKTHDQVPPPARTQLVPPAPPMENQYRQNHKHFEANNQHYISHQKAAEIALKAFENKYHKKGFVEDVDFEHKRWGDYYEVEIEDERGKDYEVNVDAKTGKVLSIKRD